LSTSANTIRKDKGFEPGRQPIPRPCALTEMRFNRIEEAIDAIRAGKIVIVADDEDRENEGDFILAAEKCTPESMNFLMRYGRGIPCVATTGNRLAELDLPMMVGHNTANHSTAMTVTVDARHGTTTDISAYDRCATVRVFVDRDARPNDLARPGHIIPLRAEE